MSGNIGNITTTLRYRCLAVCAPGLEELCAAELGERGVRIRRSLLGGVEFGATPRQLYAANLWVRTASRIVVRVATFAATTFADLEHEAGAVPWEEWIPDGTTPTVRASSTASRLYHTGGVAERLAAVAARGPGPGPLIVARLMHDRVTLSVDSSGLPLWQRGWRQEAAKAPMRETLAAAVVLASGWDRVSPLVDPLCGSGTIAIEAALLATGRPPGSGRRFAFQDWPSFQPGTWASVTGSVPAPSEAPPIVARDRDAGAVRAAGANAARAGVGDAVDVGQASVSELSAPGRERGWIVSNPPYGKRVAGGDLRDLYARLGDVARNKLAGWRIALLIAEDRLVAQTGLAFEERLRTDNGGIPVRVVVATVGDRRSPAARTSRRQPASGQRRLGRSNTS
jgi:putative N6-adenine-specific DNA methylase